MQTWIVLVWWQHLCAHEIEMMEACLGKWFKILMNWDVQGGLPPHWNTSFLQSTTSILALKDKLSSKILLTI